MQKRTDGLRLVAGTLVLCALGLFSGGCTEKPGGPMSPDREPDGVSYAGDIAPLLNRCLTCHGNPGNSNFSVRSYESLFLPGIQASSRGLLPVKAGDPDSSYMVWKLAGGGSQGEPIQGTRMPQSGAPLTSSEQELLRSWIAAGALDN